MKRMVLAVMILGMFPAHALAVDTLFVQSAKAKVMSEPKFSAELVGTLVRGDKLEAHEVQGRWYRVSTGQIDGWINKLCVSEQPPLKKVTAIKGDTHELEENARKRASAITSAAAARGLTELQRKRLSEMEKADYQDLVGLETFSASISLQEVQSFSEEGGSND